MDPSRVAHRTAPPLQELNHIKASPAPGGTTTVVVVPPQQQAMGQAPGAYGGPNPYQG